MTKHKPKDRIIVKMDVSQFYESYKLAKIGLEGMADELDKAVKLKEE